MVFLGMEATRRKTKKTAAGVTGMYSDTAALLPPADFRMGEQRLAFW